MIFTLPDPKHVPQHLRESAEFAHARIDALQASLAAALGHGKTTLGMDAEEWFFNAFQNMDRELVQKWPDIAPAIRKRES